MSSYLRSIPNKFTSLVNTRRQMPTVDHQLPRQVKSSLFLEELLGVQTATDSAVNSTEKSLICIDSLSSQSIPLADQNVNIERHKNWTKHQISRLHQQKQEDIESLKVANITLKDVALLKKDTRWKKLIIDFRNQEPNLPYVETISTKTIFDNAAGNSEGDRVLYTDISPNVQNVNEMQPSEDRKSSESQLQHVFNVLSEDLPLLFVKQVDYRIYTNDLLFVNNIKGTTTVGIFPYFKQISLLKMVGHFKYAYIKVDILKMTMHPEDNSIKVRWRIVGISGTSIFLTFWRFKIWNIKERIENQSAWYDGFSTFYVNDQGKVFKHVVDKMMPDQDVEEKVKTPIATKLALFTALLGLDSHYFVKLCLKDRSQLFRIKQVY